MHKRLLPAALLSLSLPATAMNWGFLEDAPAGRFTEGDWTLVGETRQNALDQAHDGEAVEWHNTQTGAFGIIRPLDTHERDGTNCRHTEVFNSAGGKSATSRFIFCKQPDGDWKVAPQRSPAE